jgi:hypothetical protein
MVKWSLGLGAAVLLAGAGTYWISEGGAYAAANPATHRISEAYAKTQILGDNYTNVTDLRQTKAGWTAKALESGKNVKLSVNDMGDVNKV